MNRILSLILFIVTAIAPSAVNAATPAEVASDLKTHGTLMKPHFLKRSVSMEDGSTLQQGELMWTWYGINPICAPSMGPVQYFVHETIGPKSTRILTVAVLIPNTADHQAPGNEDILLILEDHGVNGTVNAVTSNPAKLLEIKPGDANATYHHLLTCYPLPPSPSSKARKRAK